ncbi:isochorismate synthase [Knoellia sinensis KCTC 19936]|uniref:isochorismate synthase n=1 Tax=Knoellia sinensis KCTC 19936 TaxID=1385520 RepID=A0A0A0JCX7_9MICO|nr:isochorismate synthase [Knoellia sinensis]KGN33882.1 isochorismate synthase [Knoellia sinensis KCTC 19936]
MTSLPTSESDIAHLAPLVTRTVALSPEDGTALLGLLPATSPRDALSWVRRGEGLVGWGRAASVTTHGAARFEELESWWRDVSSSAVVRDEVDLPGTGPVAFGAISYAADSPSGATLVVPSVVVGRRGDQWWVTTTSPDALPGSADPVAHDDVASPGEVAFADGSLSPTEWAGAVAEAVSRIQAGALDKVVLARDLDVQTSAPIDVRWLLGRLAENYESTWVFAVDGLVGATPEMLVRREKGLVTSRVLAGTIQRTGDDEHDLALAGSLARSSKDLEEHEYAVRSVADALAPHCSSMNVPEAPFVLHLSNVMHLATDVAGVLTDETSSLALAASLHPSAAVCGTPTPVADALISELEHMDRGRYAGPVGWMDARGDGEWGIALRSGSIHHDDAQRMTLYAGCGIVAGSVPEAEVAESDAKLIPMRDALTARP